MRKPALWRIGPVRIGQVRIARSAAPALIAAALMTVTLGAETAAACTSIGSSVFCGTRGSHNTVGNTLIFNNGPAGQRLGNFAVTGSPPRTSVIRGAPSRGLAQPRTYRGVATPKRFGSVPAFESRIAALRAEILALEAQEQLRKLNLTPAQDAAKADMPPALIRALRLAQEAREKKVSATE
ncbi:hypothetical protein HBA54_26715 [Pelagibius litoralis]|uniref:Uncharacterized protein n=1 Tax=Pelagibius litoralis TaxID=374515 RepID=A0A967F392_9PROT|nr:hypothetical protein [Pelagibius litoralis]NIA72188.1 hypothetical protein [Pelagibius litoralis]